ncbi:hypothetical protein SKAU_G00057070 [Synaphobranchus kaupii]|uniref:Lipoxygenase domain-containing protein n=1 Tax=Synaphobranchus kaupii TaxID=118154 RepID=A0A9Q1G455_SYNKA|nr:hypothetical protein SKAU_G00057070 [Synaphobranchus kaupii]
MAKYIVKVEPRPTDRVYIKFPGKIEQLIKDDTTIELNGEPQEITIRRVSTSFRRLTTWRCRYVTVTSLDSEEKEFYFPVFRNISSAGCTIKENSAKLPQNDFSEERKESLMKNLKFQDTIDRHGKGSAAISYNGSSDKGTNDNIPDSLTNVSCRRRANVPESDDHQQMLSESIGKKEASSKPNSIFYSFLLGIISIFPEQLHFTYKPGIPGFVKGGNLFDLPKELWFDTLKLVTLILNAVKISAQTIFRRFWNFCHKWEKIDDIRKVFWFTSKKAAYVSQNWKDDAFFGNLFLNGCNPMMIKMYTEDQQKIPMETLQKLYPDIRENIQNGSIYVVDYEILHGLLKGWDQNSPQYLSAPIVLLQQTGDELKPIAIQLTQKHGPDNPVFSPQDKPEAWLLAKIWVRNSDFIVHELVFHLLRTHLMGEIFFIASNCMAGNHPLARILCATGRYTLPINITARNTLINKGGFFMEYTALGKDAQWVIIERATQDITYESLCLPDNLKHRGVENLKNFHYRDDGMDIWDAIYEFVHEVVYAYYKSDDAIFQDKELQDMVNSIYLYGFLQKQDCPSVLNTREEAIKYITMIMFTCSAQHAAVNNGQFDIYAWMPNGPTTMRKPVPTVKEVTEKDIMDTLPNIDTTLEAMKVTRFLSQVSKDFVALGDYPEEVASERSMREPIIKDGKQHHNLTAVNGTVPPYHQSIFKPYTPA